MAAQASTNMTRRRGGGGVGSTSSSIGGSIGIAGRGVQNNAASSILVGGTTATKINIQHHYGQHRQINNRLERRGTYSKPLGYCDGGGVGGMDKVGGRQQQQHYNMSSFVPDLITSDGSSNIDVVESDDYDETTASSSMNNCNTYHQSSSSCEPQTPPPMSPMRSRSRSPLKSCDSKDSIEKMKRRQQQRMGMTTRGSNNKATANASSTGCLEIPAGCISYSYGNNIKMQNLQAARNRRKIVITVGTALLVLVIFWYYVFLPLGFDNGQIVNIGGTTVENIRNTPTNNEELLSSIKDAPRTAKTTQQLVDKLNEDSRVQQHELEALKDELEKVKQHEVELENELLNQQQQQNLRGNNNNNDSDDSNKNNNRKENKDLIGSNNGGGDDGNQQLYPTERQIHLLNRSPYMIHIYWITDHIVDAQQNQVEWILLSGGQTSSSAGGGGGGGVQPNTTFHFHARPHHKFAIRKYTSSGHNEDRPDDWKDLFYEVPEKPVADGRDGDNNNNDNDPFIIINETWELDIQQTDFVTE